MTDQPEQSPGVPLADLIAHHEQATVGQEDIMDVARLFNQVGSSLTKIDAMNLGDGSGPAMKLDKNAVLALQAGKQNPRPRPNPPTVPPVAPGTMSAPPPSPSSLSPITSPAVTVDHKTYDQHLKKLNSVSRKLTKIEKELTNIKTIHNVNIKPGKYKINTSDGVELIATDPTLLLSVISTQLDNKAKEIIITKC